MTFEKRRSDDWLFREGELKNSIVAPLATHLNTSILSVANFCRSNPTLEGSQIYRHFRSAEQPVTRGGNKEGGNADEIIIYCPTAH